MKIPTIGQIRQYPISAWGISEDGPKGELCAMINQAMESGETRHEQLHGLAMFWAHVASVMEDDRLNWISELDPKEELHPDEIDWRPAFWGEGTVMPEEPEELEYIIIGPAGWEIDPNDLTEYQRDVLDARAKDIVTGNGEL